MDSHGLKSIRQSRATCIQPTNEPNYIKYNVLKHDRINHFKAASSNNASTLAFVF